MEGVEGIKISKIPHGIILNKFLKLNEDSFNPLNKKYNIQSDKKPIIGVISRYIQLKGIQYIIPAFAEIKKAFPNAHLVLANAVGNESEEIKKRLAQNLLPDNYTEIEFEPDIYNLYKLFDVFVHVPINSKAEAFGQTYVEALAAGVPSVFTLSGIAHEFIENEKNALVVNYKSTSEIKDAIMKILTEPELCRKIVDNGYKSLSAFSSENYVINHVNLYNTLCRQKDKK
jgi:glycosyltransferase involved in cell wall biosynthesis